MARHIDHSVALRPDPGSNGIETSRCPAGESALAPSDSTASLAAPSGVPGGAARWGAPSRVPGWLIVLVCGLAVIGVYYTLPRGGIAAVAVACSMYAFAAAASFFAAARSNGLSRLTWCALGIGMTLSTAALIPNYGYTLVTGRQIPFPSPVDAMWLLTYPCFICALIGLARHQRGADYVGQVLDSCILVIGGGTLWWVYVLQPTLHTAGLSTFPHVVSVLYPVMDGLTFAVLVGLVVSSKANQSMRLLMASFMALLASDSLYAVLLAHGTYHTGGPNDGLWMLSYLLLAVAAVHPSSRGFPRTRASAGHRVTLGRLIFLGAAMFVGPILAVTHPNHLRVLFLPSSLGFLLVMGRLAWLNRQLAAASGAVERTAGQLRHQALHDALTGLPNRALVMDRIEQLLARGRRAATVASALFVDLDDFKNVNDSLGHQAGDQLLVAVAARLASTLRDADTIGRMGGDEFVVLIEAGSHDAGAQLVAERLLSVMREPIELDGTSIPLMVNISIGIASGNYATAGELLRDADIALYQAKALGRNRYQTFDGAMKTKISRRTNLEFELRSALSNDQYRLMYQPIYNIDDLTIIGAEALLRWDRPNGATVSPDEFIPILEQTGQIGEVGRWVLQTACRQVAAWHALGDTLSISVNVSGRQLDHDSIITDIRDALDVSGLAPESLIIEVTETALMGNADATARRLRTIKSSGVRVAIDDFGTGYSSLAYLRQFPVDSLKIDRAFTSAITTSPESKALIKTLVQLGKDLGLTTLAEGVETTDEMDLLRDAHVDHAQGFLMARPLTPNDLESQCLDPVRPPKPHHDRLRTKLAATPRSIVHRDQG